MKQADSHLKKRWNIRLSGLLLLLATGVLFDQVLKEGYVFDPMDMLGGSITHEKVAIILIVLASLLGQRAIPKRVMM